MAAEQEKELKPVSRGRILGFSIFLQVVIFLGIFYLVVRFLPVSTSWKIAIGIISSLGVSFLTGFGLIFWWWAPNNLFFTFVREGTAKVVVRAHQYSKILVQFKNHTLDDNGDVIVVIGGERKPFFGGLKYYGFWPIDDIFTYEFRWTGVKESGEFEPHPTETIDFIILKDDVYGCKIEKAEDIELMPLSFEMTLTVRIVNPYKALFRIENWFETMINRIRPHIRDFATTQTYAEMIKRTERVETAILARLSEGGVLDELKDRYGVEIRKIELKGINPDEEFRKATMAKVLALRDKDTIVIKARAERERLKTEAQGEKNRIGTVYGAVQSFGELGEKIRTLESLEKSPEQGGKWIIPLPGMADILSQVFSKKRPFHPEPRRNQNGRNTSNQR